MPGKWNVHGRGFKQRLKGTMKLSLSKNRKGQGCKKSTLAREDRSLKRASLADRRKSSSELAAELIEGANKKTYQLEQ